MDHLSAVFPIYLKPAQQLSVDEMMIGTRCRVAFLQYLPKKPAKFGIKLWVLSESKSGYVLKFQVYNGAVADAEGKGLSSRVVKDVMQMYYGKNHLLYTDNFYTSPQLVRDLLPKLVYCTGTVRINRKGFPKELIPATKSMEIGSYRFASSEDEQVTAVRWKDRRDVYCLSSAHKNGVQTVLKRPKGSKINQESLVLQRLRTIMKTWESI